MRPVAARACGWALIAFAAFAEARPLLAQEARPEAASAVPRATSSTERTTSHFDRVHAQRGHILRQAPQGFERWTFDLSPPQRRFLDRHLRRMSELRRERFFREWSRMSLRERSELADRIANVNGEVRHRRELPPRLRTPEMRDRLERMSPEERRGFFARVQEWREMGSAEQRRMRTRLEKFGALSAEQQQALVDEKFARESAEERARILSALREASQPSRAEAQPPDGAGTSGTPRADAAPPDAPRAGAATPGADGPAPPPD